MVCARAYMQRSKSPDKSIFKSPQQAVCRWALQGDAKTIKTSSRNNITTKVKIAEAFRIKLKLIQLDLQLCTAAEGYC